MTWIQMLTQAKDDIINMMEDQADMLSFHYCQNVIFIYLEYLCYLSFQIGHQGSKTSKH